MNIAHVAVRLWIGVKKMSEIIEMPYGTGKTVGIWRTICLPSYPPQYRYECSKCSVCSKEMSNYCPYCGAEMQFLESEFIKTYTNVHFDEWTLSKKIYKSKCRYCGGDLEMYTRSDRSFDGSKVGYATTLFCHGCAGALFEFSFTADDIPNAEKRLLERYGIKENDK